MFPPVANDNDVEGFLVFLKRSGLTDEELAKDYRFLQERKAAFGFTRRYLLLPKGSCSSSPGATTQSLHAYMDTFRRRRANYLRKQSEASALLRSIQPFKTHLALAMLVEEYMFIPGRPAGFSTSAACICTFSQCRFRCNGVVPFLDHVLAEHP